MKKNKKMQSSRRQFLKGAAGFSLALPFLDSLAPEAEAGVPPYAANPRFVAMTTQHGGVWGQNMWPDDGAAPNTHALYSGHTAHHGALSRTVSNGTATLSNVVSGPESQLTDALVAKMNLVRGLDVPHYLGHNTGGELGNFAAEGDFIDPNGAIQELRSTIDQVMAYSDSFYPDLATIRLRSMHIGTHSHHSWGPSDPNNPNSQQQVTPLSQSSQALFNQIFVPEETEEDPRPLVVDKVLDHYSRLRSGSFGDARRLSSRDAQRLDDHMDRLRDLQTRLNAVANCGDVEVPMEDTGGLDVNGYSANIDDMRRYYQLYNDVIVAAFICGTSRIAVVNSGETWSTQFPGLCCDWHQEVAHRAQEADGVRQQLLADAKQRFFEWVFLDLVSKLDVEESNGITYLDNSLVWWTQESGNTTHNPYSVPAITAGSAAGYFNTGQYIDYRNRNNMELAHDYSPEHSLLRPGIPYQRWLANILMSMNLSPSEFEHAGEKGYGHNYIQNTAAHPQSYMDDASDPLPLLVG